jgi:hypothetical protein
MRTPETATRPRPDLAPTSPRSQVRPSPATLASHLAPFPFRGRARGEVARRTDLAPELAPQVST